jgi:anti-sigma factor RsiW
MEDQELSQAVKAKATYYSAPAELRARLRSDLNAAAGPAGFPRRSAGFNPWGWFTAGSAVGFGAMLAFSLVVSLGLGTGAGLLALPGIRTLAPGSELTDEIVAGHVRSLMASHLADVASTDQHTVKPWFNGKVDFSPPVTDLAAQGFPLTGGRLDYLDRRPVAALVYQRHAHTINVFVWPENGADFNGATASEQGYHVVQWRNAGMHFAAVSDLNVEELGGFADMLRQHATAAQ